MVESQRRPGLATLLPRTPDYKRIMDDLRQRIAAGEFTSGSKLPSQQELAAHYEVSLWPVKNALMRLELAGEVVGHQGKGVFVV